MAARQLATDMSEIEPSIVSTAVGEQVDSSQSPNGALLRGSSLDFDDAIKIEMISTQVASIDPIITICQTSTEVPEVGGLGYYYLHYQAGTYDLPHLLRAAR